jgi:hypothetical protein
MQTTNFTSSASTRLLFPQTVRQEVLEQHERLRTLLRVALEASTQGLRGGSADRLTLARIAFELERSFDAHLAFEERAVMPILASADLWGPERVRELLEEHGRQRAELRTLVEGLEAGWELDLHSVVLRSLAAELLLDMGEEERGLLRLPCFEDDVVFTAGAAART